MVIQMPVKDGMRILVRNLGMTITGIIMVTAAVDTMQINS
jgi:hypothetical protein